MGFSALDSSLPLSEVFGSYRVPLKGGVAVEEEGHLTLADGFLPLLNQHLLSGKAYE